MVAHSCSLVVCQTWKAAHNIPFQSLRSKPHGSRYCHHVSRVGKPFSFCDAFLESMCCSDPLHIKPQCLATQSENLQDHFQFCSAFLDSCLHGTQLNRMWQGVVLPVVISSIPAEDILPYCFLHFLRLSLNYGTAPSLFSFQSPLLSCPL